MATQPLDTISFDIFLPKKDEATLMYRILRTAEQQCAELGVWPSHIQVQTWYSTQIPGMLRVPVTITPRELSSFIER